MKRMLVVLFALLLTTQSLLAQSDPASPAQKMDNGQPQKRFMEMHNKFVEQAKADIIDVLFLGDSITEGWNNDKNGAKAVWDENFSAMHPANFGIGGDRTQHVLWRITNGELQGIKPKVTVLMIGTNNMGADSADGIAQGIENIVKIIRDKTDSKVLLLGIFPRGQDPADPKTKELRDKIETINTRIAKLDDGGKTIKYLDIKEKFLEPDGKISKEIMPDSLHLSKEGYTREAAAIKPVIEDLMK